MAQCLSILVLESAVSQAFLQAGQLWRTQSLMRLCLWPALPPCLPMAGSSLARLETRSEEFSFRAKEKGTSIPSGAVGASVPADGSISSERNVHNIRKCPRAPAVWTRDLAFPNACDPSSNAETRKVVICVGPGQSVEKSSVEGRSDANVQIVSLEPHTVARDSSNHLVAGSVRNVPQDSWLSFLSIMCGRETDRSSWECKCSPTPPHTPNVH